MDPIEILSRLVAISSENPPGDCKRIAEYVANLIRTRTKARVLRQKTPEGNVNIIAILGQPRFFINCHLDTVPAGSGSPAFKLRRKNGKLYGLGATDVKGPIAALLSALVQTPPRNLMLVFSCDEENGKNTGIRTFLASRYRRGLTSGIVTEPTLLNVVRYHPGVCNLELSFPGRAAHSAYPDQGINAIERAAGFITKLAGYRKRLTRYQYQGLDPTLNVAIIKGGVKSNVVPELCALKINFRNPPGLTPKKLCRELRRLAGNNKIKVKLVYSAPPLRTIPESSVLVRMLKSCGAPSDISGVNYWSEAALFGQAGIPACVFGPGDIAQAHRPDEFIRVRGLKDGRAVYCRLFGQL
jgi:acetylornithine deacetylase/succinyl-diaminopimelate desuccinylase-like protein